MSQIPFIPVPNDLTAPDTLYYETLYRRVGDTDYTRQLTNSPLPVEAVVSPWGAYPYIELPPLADATAYEYLCRRFDHNGNASAYFPGTFNTP